MPTATNEVKWTVEQVKGGRLPVRLILAIWVISIALSLLVSFAAGQPAGVIISVVAAGLMVSWYWGYNWARIVSGCYFLLGVVRFLALAIWGLANPSTYWLAIVGIIGAILMGVAGVNLMRSKNIRAYLWYLREKRTREQKTALEELEAEISGGPGEQAEGKPASK